MSFLRSIVSQSKQPARVNMPSNHLLNSGMNSVENMSEPNLISNERNFADSISENVKYDEVRRQNKTTEIKHKDVRADILVESSPIDMVVSDDKVNEQDQVQEQEQEHFNHAKEIQNKYISSDFKNEGKSDENLVFKTPSELKVGIERNVYNKDDSETEGDATAGDNKIASSHPAYENYNISESIEMLASGEKNKNKEQSQSFADKNYGLSTPKETSDEIPQVQIGQITVLIDEQSNANSKSKSQKVNAQPARSFGLRGL